MTLSEYLRRHRMTQAEFARELGLPPQTVHRYVQYGRIPAGKIMARIFKATNGEVTPVDFGRARVKPTPRTRAA